MSWDDLMEVMAIQWEFNGILMEVQWDFRKFNGISKWEFNGMLMEVQWHVLNNGELFTSVYPLKK